MSHRRQGSIGETSEIFGARRSEFPAKPGSHPLEPLSDKLEKAPVVTIPAQPPFKSETFLASEGSGRKIVHVKPKSVFFAQGSLSDGIYYLQAGRAKLTVVSKNGKEATITLLVAGDFIGEESVTNGDVRTATATAITACSALRISRTEMLRVLSEEHSFSDFFMRFLLQRGIRTQADLVDQLFNSSEKRLARTLLLMADYGKSGEPETLIPEITQEALAEMIGTTRSRVSFFMNRFRKLGYLDYNGRIHIHKSLLSVVLNDHLPEQNSSHPTITESAKAAKKAAKKSLAKIIQPG